MARQADDRKHGMSFPSHHARLDGRGTEQLELLMSIDTAHGQPDRHGWLLEDFVRRVPGATSAVLASRDGLILAGAGLTRDQADSSAALLAGLFSLASRAAVLFEPSQGAVRLVAIEHDVLILFVMSAGGGRPGGPVTQPATAQSTVGTLLGVFSTPDADAGVIGHEMATLITSVDEHLLTSTRPIAPIPAADH